MSSIPIYQVNAFTSELYTGNPAAVCLLQQYLDDETMQKISAENNLSETAFVVADGEYHQIRWFTPKKEVDLCGHATLASAFVLFEVLGHTRDILHFTSHSGLLHVQRKKNNVLCMDFPALPYSSMPVHSEVINAIGIVPQKIYKSTFDVLCILNDAYEIKNAQVDLQQIQQLPFRGLILSAKGDESDVYSRCFYPAYDVPEDPVTGSAHCVIAPYWCQHLNKSLIHAKQGGDRQGELWCQINQKRVLLFGQCRLYMQGKLST